MYIMCYTICNMLNCVKLTMTSFHGNHWIPIWGFIATWTSDVLKARKHIFPLLRSQNQPYEAILPAVTAARRWTWIPHRASWQASAVARKCFEHDRLQDIGRCKNNDCQKPRNFRKSWIKNPQQSLGQRVNSPWQPEDPILELTS